MQSAARRDAVLRRERGKRRVYGEEGDDKNPLYTSNRAITNSTPPVPEIMIEPIAREITRVGGARRCG